MKSPLAAPFGRPPALRPWAAAGLALAALALIMLACRQGQPPPPTPIPTLKPGDHTFQLTHGGRERSYLVHVPPTADPTQPIPVVLNFHGGGGNAETQQASSGMDALADEQGFIVVYPNGSGPLARRLLTWNAGACCGYAMENGVDDVGFALALLDDLAARTPIDPTRIYATGFSNGAMLAHRLGAEAADRIAAIAPVAGALMLESISPAQPLPVMHVHSVDDPRALYQGGLAPPFPLTNTRILHPPLEERLALWLEANGCPATARLEAKIRGAAGTQDEGHTGAKLVYGPCDQGTEVVLWKLSGPGHVWPGGQSAVGEELVGAPTSIIDANQEMWAFFQRFTRAGGP